MIRYLAKFSFEVKIAEAESSSSSESGLSRLCVEDAIVKCVWLDSYALQPPLSPTRDACWQRISSFQRQSYITIILAVHDLKVIQIT